MRLKSIKLAGFKSFVDATTIPFPGDMTAVVGPNGCGKSNVIDAVRWVLGESSAKNLRGDAMTDVIFNGSSARKAVSQCSVELVFDNTSGRIAGEYAAYNELSVKRIVTKEAISSYLLNGTKCRRRDITDLFLGTGLGPRSYAIIEQGMISKLIESRPQELRVFIEEAAGISKYKERRRETENRIKHTKENLERLDDVRGELGEQLNKLQRQAAAAIKYKDLKASERKLKAELAALRWLTQSEKIIDAEQVIAQKETELEQVISRQRGDESLMTQLIEQQANLKQRIADAQQQIFKVGTEITKIEQNQLFSSKRKQQIQMEVQQLQSQMSQLQELDAQTQAELEEVEHSIQSLAPEEMMMQERIEASQLARDEAQDALVVFNQTHREQDSQYHALKQQLQNTHGQIQSTLNMQMRTQSRLSELQQEQQQLQLSQISEQYSECQAAQKTSELAQQQAEISHQKSQQWLTQCQDNLEQAKSEMLEHQSTMQGLEAKIQALVSVQEDGNDDFAKVFDELSISSTKIDQFLSIQSGYENMFEVIFLHHDHVHVARQLSHKAVIDSGKQALAGAHILLSDHFSELKTPGSAAQYLDNPLVPVFLNHIKVVASLHEAQVVLPTLAPHESVISADGVWLGHDKVVNGKANKSSGRLMRAAQITQLNSMLSELQQQQFLYHEAMQAAQTLLATSKQQAHKDSEALQQARQTCMSLSAQLSALTTQRQHEQTRMDKVAYDLEEQAQQLEQEAETLAILNEQVENYAMDLAEFEDSMAQSMQGHAQLESQLQDARTQTERLTSQGHELAMALQQVQNKHHLLQEKQLGRQQQQEEAQEKLELLSEESEELAMPMAEQSERLQSLLVEKDEISLMQQALQSEIDQLDTQLSQAQRGQQGINEAASAIKAEIDSARIQAEGCKVRAQSYLETLQDMRQSLKPILENLPEDIDEKVWQQNLEKTSASLQRLGAVNLAAVQEFETQSERKAHLDAQNDDLSQALDTLETAIRKIDKETRARFKATFDQVNDDLKALFPKVFGGGSAYLDLTDDDMLDTGVTIMARPPGKKNSTIHLLSGGEKALTALSLVFAIFRLNPAPFCLLDEVDAPLDDANVGRFCKLVSEMSKSVQFIYITHNKVAMEMATHLTGVTMAEPGVSRMVAVDMEEALAIAE